MARQQRKKNKQTAAIKQVNLGSPSSGSKIWFNASRIASHILSLPPSSRDKEYQANAPAFNNESLIWKPAMAVEGSDMVAMMALPSIRREQREIDPRRGRTFAMTTGRDRNAIITDKNRVKVSSLIVPLSGLLCTAIISEFLGEPRFQAALTMRTFEKDLFKLGISEERPV
ncbi:hypothetical protein IW261DRAFT_1427059 [Armillaria novae-zelandiae]|uniref:Uncharacterized protein n=1 Tax=Armillaria novae-zelandiae TaxID=153914 RepID=A0AA39NHM9_9AGAR|nr:hypothetical protein IW261DRAFT_1427059 [Armillaria novae-zelandiae]